MVIQGLSVTKELSPVMSVVRYRHDVPNCDVTRLQNQPSGSGRVLWGHFWGHLVRQTVLLRHRPVQRRPVTLKFERVHFLELKHLRLFVVQKKICSKSNFSTLVQPFVFIRTKPIIESVFCYFCLKSDRNNPCYSQTHSSCNIFRIRANHICRQRLI